MSGKPGEFDQAEQLAALRDQEAADGEPLGSEESYIRSDGGHGSPAVNFGKIGQLIVGLEPETHGTIVYYRDHVEVWPAESEVPHE